MAHDFECTFDHGLSALPPAILQMRERRQCSEAFELWPPARPRRSEFRVSLSFFPPTPSRLCLPSLCCPSLAPRSLYVGLPSPSNVRYMNFALTAWPRRIIDLRRRVPTALVRSGYESGRCPSCFYQGKAAHSQTSTSLARSLSLGGSLAGLRWGRRFRTTTSRLVLRARNSVTQGIANWDSTTPFPVS